MIRNHLSKVKCFFLGHDYTKHYADGCVDCDRCGRINFLTSGFLLDSEIDAWQKVVEGEWSRDMAETYIAVLWGIDEEEVGRRD